MNRNHARVWLLILAGASGLAAWIMAGKGYARRRFYPAPPISDERRTESGYIAVLLPRISAQAGKYTMSAHELTQFLGGLKEAGYVSIGLDDLTQLHSRKRKLPPLAVLIAFAQDDPRGFSAADSVLKRLRLRGTAFIKQTAGSSDDDQRQYLTRHAVSQMRLGGAWEFGAAWNEGASPVSGAGEMQAVLIEEASPAPASAQGPYPMRFEKSEQGANAQNDDPQALKILTIRADRSAGENLRIVRNSWPRGERFYDDFSSESRRADWIAGWGVVAMGNRRMAILPTPRQTSAGVYLRGTERWSSQILEFELKRYEKEFWVYARYADDGRFVRVGARNGHWYVEQKIGEKYLPSMLARAPMQEGVLPARVRLVLKGESGIVHVNGRMLFGRAVRIHPAVDRGRVLLGVYDERTRSALAVLTSMRAAPLAEAWIALKPGSYEGLSEEHLDGLREEAVHARVLSPLWIKVSAEGEVTVTETQGMLIRSLAGFYGCRLVPMVEMPVLRDQAFSAHGSIERLAGGLADAARDLESAGLNLRLRGGPARPTAIAVISKLQAALHARRRQLWVTIDGAGGRDVGLTRLVDGMLEPSLEKTSNLELLVAVQGEPTIP